MTDRSESAGLREQKKARARAAIVEAALQLYRERGFSGVTVDQIAERAGVARRTYFRYFATKEAAVMDRRLGQLARFKALLASRPLSEPAIDVVKHAARIVASDYERARERILVERHLFETSSELAARDLQVDREFEAAIAEVALARTGRTPAATRGAKFFAAAAMGVLRVLLEEWAADATQQKPALDLVKIGEVALDTVALLAPPHKKGTGK